MKPNSSSPKKNITNEIFIFLSISSQEPFIEILSIWSFDDFVNQRAGPLFIRSHSGTENGYVVINLTIQIVKSSDDWFNKNFQTTFFAKITSFFAENKKNQERKLVFFRYLLDSQENWKTLSLKTSYSFHILHPG